MKALCIDQDFGLDYIAEVERYSHGNFMFKTDSNGYVVNKADYPKWVRNTSIHKEIVSRQTHGLVQNRWAVFEMSEREYSDIRKCIDVLPQESFDTISNLLSVRLI